MIRGDAGHTGHDCIFTAGNDLDQTDLTTFTGSHDAGIDRWYDQSTSANDLTLAAVGVTSDQSPLLVNTGTVQTQNGKACPRFVSSATGGDAFFDFSQIGNTGSAVSQPFSIAMAFGFFNSAGTAGLASNVGGNLVAINNSGTAYQITAGLAITGGTLDNNFHTLIAVFNGASSQLLIDGSAVISGNAGSNALYGASAAMGCGSTVSLANIAEYLIFPVDITASGTDASKIRSSWQTYWGAP